MTLRDGNRPPNLLIPRETPSSPSAPGIDCAPQ
jgi:hypothetical protein